MYEGCFCMNPRNMIHVLVWTEAVFKISFEFDSLWKFYASFWNLVGQAAFSSEAFFICPFSLRLCGLYRQEILRQHLCIKSWSIMMKRFDLISS